MTTQSPSSAGGALIAFALKLLARVPLARVSHNGFEHLKILTEAMRLTNIARAEWEKISDQTWVDPVSFDSEGVDKLIGDDNIQGYAYQLHKLLTGQARIYVGRG